MSPLAEGRELKYLDFDAECLRLQSPLAEGRELKWRRQRQKEQRQKSPLAEGRELKFLAVQRTACPVLVAPRGGA